MAYSLTLGTIAFLIAVVWGSPLISWLKENRIGKQIRMDGPSGHLYKTGTPTMGGLLFIIPVLLITGALNLANLLGLTLIGRSVLVPMATMIAFGGLGLIDDLAGIRGKRAKSGEGILGRTKFIWQWILALVIALVLYSTGGELRNVRIPGLARSIDIGLLYIPVVMFLMVSFANAVNLTDGLDALAGSLAAVAFVSYGVIAYLQGQIWLVAFCFTVVGALMAFLWYNSHPADMFMGDTGAMALGATLGVVAFLTGQWLLLPVVALVFVAETLSVMLQVAYFKLTKGKRLFKMAPLHHHFELLGWSETQVQQRFWICGILCGMLGIALALL